MKKHIVILVFLFLGKYAGAQVIYSKDYLLSPIYYSGGANVKPTSDGGFITILSIYDKANSQTYGAMISKFDENGKLSWTQYLSHIVTNPSDVIEYSRGYFVTGYTGDDRFQLIKFNEQGAVVWRKFYNDTTATSAGSHQGFSLHMLNNTDLLMYGVHETQPGGDPLIIILKIDTAGNYKWSKQYTYTYTYNHAIMDEQKNLVTAYGNEILSVDSSGKVNYHLTLNNVYSYSSCGLAVAGNVYLTGSLQNDTNCVYKVNSKGIVEWVSNYFRMNINNMISYENGLLLAGTYVSKKKVLALSIAKMDYNGTLLWQTTFDADTSAISSRIIELKNGQLALLTMYPQKFRISLLIHPNITPCGSSLVENTNGNKGNINYSSVTVNPTPLNLYALASSCTVSGYSFPDTLVCRTKDFSSINSIENKLPANVYPNPFDELTTFTYEFPKNIKTAFLRIYDIKGTLMQSYPLSAEKGSINISASDFKNGVYLYGVEADGWISPKKKMVIIK